MNADQKGWGARERVFTGANVLLMVILAGGILVGANFLAFRFPLRMDLSPGGAFTLSETTRNFLEDLDREARITVFFALPAKPELRPAAAKALVMVQELLNEYSRISSRVRIDLIAPNDDRREVLMNEYGLDPGKMDFMVFVVSCGERRKEIPWPEVVLIGTPRSSSKENQELPRIFAFMGEEAFTSALLHVTQEQEIKVCFTQGHGEMDLKSDDPYGLSEVRRLLARYGYRPEEFSSDGPVPSGCDLLVVAAPQPPRSRGGHREFFPRELYFMNKYLEKGGCLLLVMRPGYPNTLNPLLERFGLEFGEEETVLCDEYTVWGQGGGAPNFDILVQDGFIGNHPITDPLIRARAACAFVAPREILSPSSPVDVRIGRLARTSANAFKVPIEVLERGESPALRAGSERGSFLLAATAEREIPAKLNVLGERTQEEAFQRIALFGTNTVFSNQFMTNPKYQNRILFLNTLTWLTGRKKVAGIAPREEEQYLLLLGEKGKKAFMCLVLAGVPLLPLLIGLVVFYLRRK